MTIPNTISSTGMKHEGVLQEGLSFLRQYIQRVLKKELIFGSSDMPIPALPPKLGIPYMNISESIVFWLALAPHVDPAFLDNCIRAAIPEAGDFPELGGMRGKQHRGFLPTGETALYLLAGDNVERRAACMEVFASSHYFSASRLLWLGSPPEGEPPHAGLLTLSTELVERITLGREQEPKFSREFPARKIHTNLNWEDLICTKDTQAELQNIFDWLKFEYELEGDFGLKKHVKPGFRGLFYGPPGTGKTLAASLLGKASSLPVYRVDLASVVSKYIGETEKNLSGLFDKAENRKWILFFDEADALFGKRTNVSEAKDRFANQEVSYLLQRVEEFPGLVILASNFKSNIDDAFLRRFHAVVHFPMPSASERLLLWQSAIPEALSLEESISLKDLAMKYELTGADIVQVVRFASIRAALHHDRVIQHADILTGIKREFQKAGRI